MGLETWLAFAAASAVLLAIPGPTILLVLSYALGRGWSSAAPVAIGVALGDFTAMTLSMLGVGALLAGSATLFTVLKWLGSAYLMWLGLKLWQTGTNPSVEERRSRGTARQMIGHAWLVTTLNPKSILFFVAFLPQFVDPARTFWVQAAIFEATFVSLGIANALGYAWLGSRAGCVVNRPGAPRLVSRASGTALIAAGAAAAMSRA
jgi:homoserine/homoserine lactone efflux protein